MNSAIEQMLKSYHVENIYDRKNVMKEIMQEIVLCGLSRAGFFKKAAFYGGTALRIFYGLDRFSEDLDFSLEAEDLDFDLTAYFPVLEKEVKAFGLNVEIQEKEKTKESTIRSAFLKGNTKEHLLLFYADEKVAGSVAKNEAVKIKFEVDVNPPAFAAFEHKYRLLPVPYEVRLYDMPSLFAGKIHAVICRAWQSRIKGREARSANDFGPTSTKVRNAPSAIRSITPISLSALKYRSQMWENMSTMPQAVGNAGTVTLSSGFMNANAGRSV